MIPRYRAETSRFLPDLTPELTLPLRLSAVLLRHLRYL